MDCTEIRTTPQQNTGDLRFSLGALAPYDMEQDKIGYMDMMPQTEDINMFDSIQRCIDTPTFSQRAHCA